MNLIDNQIEVCKQSINQLVAQVEQAKQNLKNLLQEKQTLFLINVMANTWQ